MIGLLEAQTRSEGDFTLPREECPHPEWWRAYDTDSSEVEVSEFVAAMVRLLKPSVVVETGSCYGRTTEAIGKALLLNGRGHCFSLEIDPARVVEAQGRCAGLPVDVIQTESLRYMPPYPVDFAFLDSEFHLRVQEWYHFNPKYAVFHDTGDHYNLREDVESIRNATTVFFPTPRGVCVSWAQ